MDLIICGTGQLEILQLIDDINNSSTKTEHINLIGFLDDNHLNTSRDLKGYSIIGGFDWLEKNNTENIYLINSIGRTCEIRKESTLRLKSFGGKFTNLIHPSVDLKYCKSIGIGNIIFEYGSLKINSSIGNHNMLLNGVILGHGTSVGSYCFFGHYSVCNGDTKICDSVFIGSGSHVSPCLTIKEGVTLSIGSILNCNAKSNHTYFGNPARGIKKNKPL